MSSRGGDAELERGARREPQLVDRVDVPRVGDRDPERVVLERVRHRDDALERVHGNELRRVAATPTAGRSTSGSWWRTASVRAMPSPVATPSSTIACASVPLAARPRTSASSSGGRARSARAGRRRARPSRRRRTAWRASARRWRGSAAAVGRRSEARWACDVSYGDPSNEVSAAGSARLDARTCLQKSVRYASRIALAGERARRPRRARGTARTERHLPRGGAVPGHEHDAPARARRPSRSSARPARTRPSIAPSSSASLTSPMPIPFG